MNFGIMLADIRSEIRRTTMDAAIKKSIVASVDYWKDKRFKWNESRFTFSTVASQDEYSSSDDADIGYLAKIDSILLSTGSTEWKPKQVPVEVIEDIYDASGTGDPTMFAYYRSRIRFYVIPSRVLTVTVLGLQELLDTSQAADYQRLSRAIPDISAIPSTYTTSWFTDGYEVTKLYAKGYLFKHHMQNAQVGDALFTDAIAIGKDFQNKLGKLGGSGFVQPTSF